jgi:site-specific recombinase XerD
MRNGRYVADFYPEGRKGPRKQISLPVGIDLEKALELELQLKILATNQVKQKNSPDGTVSTHFQKYLEWYKIHRQPTTYRDIESIFRTHVEPILGSIELKKIGLAHIDFYKKTRKEEGANNATINKELSYFAGFLRWAEENKLIDQRAFRIRKLPYKRPLPMTLSPEEVNAILENMEQPYRAFVTALYTLGLRFSEAANLSWNNVDLTVRQLRVRQKGGGWKILPINPRLYDELIAIKNKDGFVFRSIVNQGRIRDIRKALWRAKEKAGIKRHIYPHLFRHSIATTLMDKGVNMRIIQGYLGHADITTTQWYTQVAIENLKAAENAIIGMTPEVQERKELNA